MYQKCVYHLLSGQWLRKTFPDAKFANSNLPEKRCRIFLSKEENLKFQENSTDVCKRNMTEMYNDCPNVSIDSGRYSVLEYFCSAESLRYCYVTRMKVTVNPKI